MIRGGLALLLLPLASAQSPLHFVALAAGDNFGCGLTAEGAAYCWGNDEVGQTGSPPPVACAAARCAAPPRRVASDVPFIRIDAGHEHVCALSDVGTAYCWGSNVTGALGTSAALGACTGWDFVPGPGLVPGCSARPIPVEGGLTFTSITAGPYFTCGLTPPGNVHCWGMSGAASDRVIHRTPRKLAAEGPFRSVSAGNHQLCAVDARGRAHCWEDWSSERAEIVPAPEPFASVSVGWGHVCALTAAGTAYCWGENHSGQVGTGRTPRSHERLEHPAPVAGLRPFREIVAGFARSCAISTDHALFCWGEDAGVPGSTECFHGDAFSPCTPGPVRVTDLIFRSVALGVIHSCAVTTDGHGYCWGRNYHGGFGDGRSGVIADTPVRVEWRD